MYTFIGMFVIVGTIAALLVMMWRGKAAALSILAMGVIAITGGVAIPNLEVVKKVQMTGGGGCLTAEMERAVKTVTTKTSEVQTKATEIGDLVNKVEAIEQRVESVAK